MVRYISALLINLKISGLVDAYSFKRFSISYFDQDEVVIVEKRLNYIYNHIFKNSNQLYHGQYSRFSSFVLC